MATMTATRQAGERAAGRRRDPRDFHPFLRLGRLLQGQPPGRSPLPDGAPLDLAIGDPKIPAPAWLAEEIARHPGSWSSYPPFRGLESYREACAAWLERRYRLPEGLIDQARHVLPLPGSREGLFFTTLAAVNLGAAEGRDRVLLPAPAYHVYVGSAAAAGAEPVFVPASRESGFLPDIAALDPALLERTAIAFVCSPSNPEGAAADVAGWRRLIEAARRHGFVLAADECYAEIYCDRPPEGVLQAAAESGSLERVLSFHSLSKRSSAAGLRCGFVAGDPSLVDTLDAFLRFGGAGTPVPILQAGAALWRDEAHARANRAYYQGLFALAERKLGKRFGWSKPAGGFFLWLEVGDGEAAATALWREAGLRVLPGSYMCPGTTLTGDDPGAAYVRVAMIHAPETTEAALERLIEVL